MPTGAPGCWIDMAVILNRSGTGPTVVSIGAEPGPSARLPVARGERPRQPADQQPIPTRHSRRHHRHRKWRATEAPGQAKQLNDRPPSCEKGADRR